MAEKKITVSISPVTQDQLDYLRHEVAETFGVDPDSYSLDDIIALCIERAAKELAMAMVMAEIAGITEQVREEAHKKYEQRTEPQPGDLKA